jgi:hypothetical protein
VIVLPYVPYQDLAGRPSIVVDGAAAPGTVLTLSHWPGSAVRPALRRDLSAQIVFAYLEAPAEHVEAEAVSNNHFDEDGLVGVWALVDPEAAMANRDLAIDVARAGDFATFESRDAARVSFAIARLADPATSPLDPALFEGPYDALAAALYEELLARLPALVDDVAGHRELWAEEDALLDDAERLFAAGGVAIDEYRDVDLAVVTSPAATSARRVHRFTQRRHQRLHPMAVHNRTDRLRVAYVSGQSYDVHLRYETWVQFVSRPVLPRIDLAPLADQLNQEESGGVWRFDGVAAITPRLWLHGGDDERSAESSLAPADFVARLRTFLTGAPPAWDPFSAASD